MTHAIYIAYHPAVRDEDMPLIDGKSKDRIRKAGEERLQTAPQGLWGAFTGVPEGLLEAQDG